jgi:hypothetical protein
MEHTRERAVYAGDLYMEADSEPIVQVLSIVLGTVPVQEQAPPGQNACLNKVGT